VDNEDEEEEEEDVVSVRFEGTGELFSSERGRSKLVEADNEVEDETEEVGEAEVCEL
jgi:hypothetical protein